MPRFANREMMTPALSRAGGQVRVRPAPQANTNTTAMRYDDGSRRVVQVRPREMNSRERRQFHASIVRISRAHAEDLQTLANI